MEASTPKWKTYLKKLGWAGFLFFFIKGLIWIAIFLGVGKLFSQARVQTPITWESTVFIQNSGKAFSIVNTKSWDLAFENFGQGAGIRTQTSQGVKAWVLPETAFQAWPNVFQYDTAQLMPCVNSHQQWELGAFNSQSKPPFDFGWGTYNLQTHTVVGKKVFYVQTTDNQLIAVKINAIQGTNWEIEVAYSPTQVRTLSIPKVQNTLFQYLDLDTLSLVEIEPENWQFQITQHPNFKRWVMYVHPKIAAQFQSAQSCNAMPNPSVNMGNIQDNFYLNRNSNYNIHPDSNRFCFGFDTFEVCTIRQLDSTFMYLEFGNIENGIANPEGHSNAQTLSRSTYWPLESAPYYSLYGQYLGVLEHQQSLSTLRPGIYIIRLHNISKYIFIY